jgi:hypothetical protein
MWLIPTRKNVVKFPLKIIFHSKLAKEKFILHKNQKKSSYDWKLFFRNVIFVEVEIFWIPWDILKIIFHDKISKKI